jgi:hypothetical protein
LPKVCFVICPIGSFGSEIREAADDFIKYIVTPCTHELGYDEPIRADKLPEPGRITSQIIELLNSADLVIADLSRGNANVYYELSCRHAIGKPAIHMAFEGTQLSFDVADNRTIPYTMHASRVEQAREQLTAQIKRVEEPGYKPRNPILDAIGLISLERSTEPTQQSLASLIRQVTSLQSDIASLRGDILSSRSLAFHPTVVQHDYASLGGVGTFDVSGDRVFVTGPTGPNLASRNYLGDLARAAGPTAPTGPTGYAVTDQARAAKPTTPKKDTDNG